VVRNGGRRPGCIRTPPLPSADPPIPIRLRLSADVARSPPTFPDLLVLGGSGRVVPPLDRLHESARTHPRAANSRVGGACDDLRGALTGLLDLDDCRAQAGTVGDRGIPFHDPGRE